MTLQETLEKLDGHATKVGLRLEGGVTVEVDGKWKKYGIAPEMWLALNPEQDPVEAMEVLQATLQAFLANYLKPIEEHYNGLGAKVVEEETVKTEMAPIEGVEDEVEWIMPVSFYVHRSEGKQPVAFFKDEKKYKEKGATAFAKTFKDAGLDLYGLEPGKTYKPEEYNIGKVAVKDDKVIRFGGLL